MTFWFTPIDLYCERQDPSLWAEPLNALSNAAFLVAAWAIWRRHSIAATLLAVQIALIGLGSLMFHVFANRITGLLDVGFIAVYLMVFPVMLVRLSWRRSWTQTVPWAFLVPVMILITDTIYADWRAHAPWWSPPGMYLAAWLSLAILASVSFYKSRSSAWWLCAAVIAFGVSLTLRQLDMPLCAHLEDSALASLGGTHSLWHILNAFVLWASAQAVLPGIGWHPSDKQVRVTVPRSR